MRSARRVLVLYWNPPADQLRTAVRHHLRALDYARVPLDVRYYNTYDGLPRSLRHVRFDAIVLHTTFLCMRWSHLFAPWKWGFRWLADTDAVKIALPQDEYDHSETLDEWLHELGVSVIFSNFGEQERWLLYPLMSQRARFYKAFTGYVDDVTAGAILPRLAPPERRPHDVVYRATHLPYWFGSHGQLKHRIGDVAREVASRQGLAIDISTRAADTIVGDEWLEFLASGRAVVGSESGSSVLDRRGEIRASIQSILNDEPALTFEEVSEKLPRGWDEYEFFAVSPRHFEAVMTKTAQVLVSGSYDGVLEPETHYIPVRRDLGDLDGALQKIRDPEFVREVTERAYSDICLSGRYGYRSLAAALERIVSDTPRRSRPTLDPMILKAIPIAATAAGRARAPLFGLGGARLLGRFALKPRAALARALVVVRVAAAVPQVRRLLRAYGRDAEFRRAVSVDFLVADIVRLASIRAVRVQGVSIDTVLDLGDRALVFRTERDRTSGATAISDVAAAIRGSDVERIMWDHSRAGTPVILPTIRGRSTIVVVGPSQTHEFVALAAFAARNPDDAAELVAELLRPLPGGRAVSSVPPTSGNG